MLTKSFTPYRTDGHWIWVQRSSHGLHNRLEVHQHDYIELVYVVHGEGRHQIGEEQYELRAGDVYMIQAGETHAYPDVLSSSLEIVNCLFVPESVQMTLPSMSEAILQLPYIAPFYGESVLPRRLQLTSEQSTEILTQLESMLQEAHARNPGFETLNRIQLFDMLIRLSRFALLAEASLHTVQLPSSGHEILIRRVKQILETHYMNKLTVPELAQEFCLSERHFNRIVKKETGMSVTSLLQKIRIERAKHMLRETDRSIEAIAAAVGFGDASFFTRLFSRWVGETPGSYRKQAGTRYIS